MSNQWNATDAARFDRYKSSVIKLGQREGDAAATAADRVERERSEPREPASSEVRDGRKPLEHRTIEELYLLARQRKLPGRSRMNKAELIEALIGEMSR